MSRNKILSHTDFFNFLDGFFSEKEYGVLRTQGMPRFLKLDVEDLPVLEHAEVQDSLRIGNGKIIQTISHNADRYFVCFNFSNFELVENMLELDSCGAFFQLAVNDLKLTPVGSADEIKDAIDFGKMGDVGYEGHDLDAVSGLYAPVRVLKFVGGAEEPSWLCNLVICISELRESDSWIDSELAEDLLAFGGLDYVSIPYELLCRSIFDPNPRSFFLSLYQCLEGLYSRQKSLAVISKFSPLDDAGRIKKWNEVSSDLETVLGWRPNEKTSLIELLKSCPEADHERLLEATVYDGTNSKKEKYEIAGNQLYKTRNMIVHFRPATAYLGDFEKINWNQLCRAMLGYIFHIYDSERK